jgi:hypothetical protein
VHRLPLSFEQNGIYGGPPGTYFRNEPFHGQRESTQTTENFDSQHLSQVLDDYEVPEPNNTLHYIENCGC